MNLILLFASDFISTSRVRLAGRRFEHIQDILKARPGQTLTVGQINGLIGQGTIVHKKSDSVELDIRLDQKPPEPLSLTLVLALPRPSMLKRILFSAAMLGVKKIIILNFNRVEKSLWNSSALKPQAIEEQLVLGLEQAKDTVLPEVILKKRFKPFIEDELSVLIKGKLALVAHPCGGAMAGPFSSVIARSESLQFSPKTSAGTRATPDKNIRGQAVQSPDFLIIGPEGGILDYEIDLLKKAGCRTLDLGPRIIRTDSVLPFVIGKLFYPNQRRIDETKSS